MTATPLRVLMVEDSPNDAAELCRRLERAGYAVDAVRVTTAPAMAAAFESGRFDLVLSDSHLRHLASLEAMRLTEATGLDLPFIIVSGQIGEDRVIELMRAGAHDCVMKQQLARLVPAVQRELREARVRHERRRAEEALRASEQRYRELFENASDMVFTLDLQGRFTSFNRACALATGYTREEAMALDARQMVAPEDAGLVDRLASVSPWNDAVRRLVQLTIIGKDGRRIAAEMSWRPIVREGQVVGIEAIARDLTERRRLEEQLRQAQKMEAIGRLAGGIAHDFNNLLMAVTGYSELLLERLDLDDSLRRNAEEIRNAAARAAGLTRQLLTFSRRQVLKPSIVDLNAVVSDLEHMLRRLIGEDVTFSTALVPGPATIRADRGQIEQVLMNLVVNARDAMPGGGELTVTTGRVMLDVPEARDYPGLAPGPYVELQVRDTGAGMSEEVLSHLFEPFFTTKEAGRGTGLGLSTVYGIVTQSGGRVTVRSAEGQGTTFTVLLPAVQGVAAQIAARQGFDSLPRGSETILLVEDEEGVRELIRDFLERCGYTVIEATQPTQALELFETNRDRLDLLITDVIMPQMNGRELAELLLGRRPGLRVLYISGYTDDQELVESVAATGDFLQKPFTPDVLARKVREVLDARGSDEGP